MSIGPPDIKWITDFQRGDENTLIHIFRLYNKALRYFAEQIIRDRLEAEDIVAETFLKLWKRRENFDSLPNIRAFLYITTRNACFDYLQYAKRKTEREKEIATVLHNDEDQVGQKITEAEILGEVYREVENLPKECKKIFKLSFFEHLSNQQIADQMGISPYTVKNQKARAIKLLRERIGLMKWFMFIACLRTMTSA